MMSEGTRISSLEDSREDVRKRLYKIEAVVDDCVLRNKENEKIARQAEMNASKTYESLSICKQEILDLFELSKADAKATKDIVSDFAEFKTIHDTASKVASSHWFEVIKIITTLGTIITMIYVISKLSGK